MTTSFPAGLDALTNPTGASSLTSPDHAGQHTDANDAIESLQAKVGVDGSAVTSSLDYKVTNGIHSALNVDSGVLVVDATNNRVGVGTASPTQVLDVFGVVRSSGYAEKWLVDTATSISGTQTLDALTNTSYFYAAAATGDFPINVRGSASVTLNTMMAVGDQLTITFITFNGAGTGYPNLLEIDGAMQYGVFWQGGTAPTAGSSYSFNTYIYTIIKIGSGDYATFASQTRFI